MKQDLWYSIRINPKTRRELDKLAEQTNLSRASVIRNLIHQAAQQHINYQPLTIEKIPQASDNAS